MIEGKTSTGFEFKLEDEVLDDYELLEVLCDVDDGNMAAIRKVLPMLLGEDQATALKEHLRGDTGRVSASKLFDAVAEIFNTSKELKNS